MVLWLVLGAITCAVLAGLLVPLLRPHREARPRAAFEMAVFRDRVSEVDREADRGILTQKEAMASKTEIYRQMLAAADTEEPNGRTAGAAGAPYRWISAAIVAAMVPLGALAVYLSLGSPDAPDQPYAGTTTASAGTAGHTESEISGAIQRLAQRLERNPDDREGWLLLARSYAAAGLYDRSAEAYQRLLSLSDGDGATAGDYAETLVKAAGGIVTPKARAVFERLIGDGTGGPRARYYLALAEAQAGNGRRAIELWLALERDSPPDAPWRSAVRQRIERTAESLGIDPPPPAPGDARLAETPPPGPTADDVAAAQDMSPDGRLEMIRGMVGRLAARLEDEPGDVDGWLRLARSYAVLGETERATEAIRRAAAVDSPPAVRARVAREARNLGVEIDHESAGDAGMTAGNQAGEAQVASPDRPAAADPSVARLAPRLDSAPEDAEGWTRLARSYQALNRPDDARRAYARAVALDPRNIALVASYSEAIMEAPDLTAPLPEASIEIMRAVLQLDGANRQALWYVGLAESQGGNAARAADLWRRLLSQLRPDAPAYALVKQRIAALGPVED